MVRRGAKCEVDAEVQHFLLLQNLWLQRFIALVLSSVILVVVL